MTVRGNEYETIARARKADLLCEALTVTGLAGGLTLTQIAQAAEGLDAAGWEAAERASHTHPGSPTTRALVVSRLYRRAELAGSDPFAGIA